jgi:hypothetical protein
MKKMRKTKEKEYLGIVFFDDFKNNDELKDRLKQLHSNGKCDFCHKKSNCLIIETLWEENGRVVAVCSSCWLKIIKRREDFRKRFKDVFALLGKGFTGRLKKK